MEAMIGNTIERAITDAGYWRAQMRQLMYWF
jgi:hypothetical protein